VNKAEAAQTARYHSWMLRGRSDTKMAALASPLALPRENISYFLDSPRNMFHHINYRHVSIAFGIIIGVALQEYEE